MGSLNETQSHLCAAYDREYLTKDVFGDLFQQGTEIRKMTIGFIKSMVMIGSGVKNIRKIPSWSEQVWEMYGASHRRTAAGILSPHRDLKLCRLCRVCPSVKHSSRPNPISRSKTGTSRSMHWEGLSSCERTPIMATFFVLPSRHQLGQRLVDLLHAMFAGDAYTSWDWPDLADPRILWRHAGFAPPRLA